MEIDTNVLNANAVISECGLYRYALKRKWSDGQQVLFVMLNPSTADATEDDPTIRRCINFAKSWGYGGLAVANLFAFRTPSPTELFKADNPVGEENDAWIERLSAESALTVAAWGNSGSYMGRGRDVAGRLVNLHYLKLTSEGQPGHPLYIAGDTKPTAWIP